MHSLKSCVSKLWIFFNVFSWFTIAYNLIAQRSVKMPPGHISVNGTPMYIKRVLMEPGKMSKVKNLFECLFIFKWNQKFLIIIRFCWNGTRCIQIRLLTARVFRGFLRNILIVQPVLSCINRFIYYRFFLNSTGSEFKQWMPKSYLEVTWRLTWYKSVRL